MPVGSIGTKDAIFKPQYAIDAVRGSEVGGSDSQIPIVVPIGRTSPGGTGETWAATVLGENAFRVISRSCRTIMITDKRLFRFLIFLPHAWRADSVEGSSFCSPFFP